MLPNVPSLLKLAVQGAHLEMCQVLLHAGADPYEETSLQRYVHSHIGFLTIMRRSAYDYALDMILGNQIDDYTLQGFQRLFNNADV